MAEAKEDIDVICNNPVVTNNSTSNIDVIWSAADALPHFSNENCLPVIGSCQVSSILSTIENHPKEPEISPLETTDNFKSIAFNVCSDGTLQDNLKRNKKKKEGNVVLLEKKQLYQEMVFFGCNLCPFICTKDSKISDHINLVHKTQGNNKRPKLKCPGCTNIFYHKLSLRSHLIHDHEVGRSDINKIVNGIVYVSSLVNSENDKIKVDDIDDTKKMEPPIDFLTNDAQISSDDEMQDMEGDEEVLPNLIEQQIEHEMEDDTQKCNAEPQVTLNIDNITTKIEDNLLTDVLLAPIETISINRRRNSNSKLDEDKKVQKCIIPTCAVRMRDLTNMSYHVRSHFGKIFNCIECGDKFSAWRTLQTHLWRHHKMDMELYSCDKCDYKTYSLAKLNNVHKLIHGDEKPFLCDFCGKGFKNPKQLRNHKIVHKMKSSELQHRCETCDRMFADKRQLRVHMNSVHQKIKPFSCNYCGYKGASNGALRLHIRQHTGEKPFSCDSCDYTTSDHNSLRRHKSRHSGIKKYKCAHCDYACIQSSTYKTHLKTKHPGLENELMFSCHMCQFRTVSKDKFMIHVASHKEKRNRKHGDLLDNIYREDYQNGAKKNDKNFDNTDDLQKMGFRIPRKQLKTLDNCVDEQLTVLPVALISKYDLNTNITLSANDCIILPVDSTDKNLNLVDTLVETNSISVNPIPPNNVQFIYNGTGDLVELTDGKEKT